MREKVKLIIEVDKKYYEACKDAVKELYPSQIEEIIAHGTVLPKGHGRLIDDINNMTVDDIVQWCKTHPDPEKKKQYEEELSKAKKLMDKSKKGGE